MSEESWLQHKIVDHAHGLIAAIFQHPADWRAESRVEWVPQHRRSPVRVSAMAAPQGRDLSFQFYPMQSFLWPPMPLTSPGQNVEGVIQIQPVSPQDAMARIILPSYRGGVADLKISAIDAQPEPTTPDPRAPQAQLQAFRITARIEFDFNGARREEEFSALQSIVAFPPSGWGMPPMISWTLTDICSVGAVKGGLDAALPTALRIRRSFQINPQFKDLVQRTVRNMIAQAGRQTDALLQQGSEQIARNAQASREFMARNQAYVDQQQARVDAMANPVWTQTSSVFSASDMMGDGDRSGYTSHDQFVDAMREEQTVHNPENSANSKISNHVDYVWKDHEGNLIGSDDPNYDPNRGSDRRWTQATIRKPNS